MSKRHRVIPSARFKLTALYDCAKCARKMLHLRKQAVAIGDRTRTWACLTCGTTHARSEDGQRRLSP